VAKNTSVSGHRFYSTFLPIFLTLAHRTLTASEIGLRGIRSDGTFVVKIFWCHILRVTDSTQIIVKLSIILRSLVTRNSQVPKCLAGTTRLELATSAVTGAIKPVTD